MKKISFKNGLWTIAILALFSGLLNFYAALQSSAASSQAIFQLVRSQLLYVLSEKDDMELIDWGKLLASSHPEWDLSASLDGKAVLSIGQLQTNPLQAPLGFHFLFPNRWSFHEAGALWGPGGAQLNFVLSFALNPNPWAQAFLNSALVFLAGLFVMTQFKGQNKLEPAALPSVEAAKTSQSRPIPTTSNIIPGPHLRMDKGYLIQFVSPGASDLFHKKEGELLEHHILDLSPQPRLLEILKKGQNDKISDAFLPPISLSASLIKDNEDWVILLEALENGQKH